jgi:formamidopyrimidine-DNA glycosylase
VPELPEVETVRRTLSPIIGATIGDVWTSGQRLHASRRIPRKRLLDLVDHQITALRRIGKYLLIDTDGDDTLLVHLGMTGRLRIQSARAARAPHTHVVLSLDQRRSLRFTDPRRFGQIDVVTRGAERDHAGLAILGPDPIAETLTGAHLKAVAKTRRRTTLKAFILDQGVVAGVGNIYASEALWRAGLHPRTRTRRLSKPRAEVLATAIIDVLRDALEHNGTTLSDFVDADGASGEHFDYLDVYDRAGQPCRRCGRTIARTIIQGRATYHCPTCQRH